MTKLSKVIALSGGIGGAKLALGLYDVLNPDELMVICNTGDDFSHFGLAICPDIDTVIYTLAGRNNQEAGWGLAGESWNCMQSLAELGAENWFSLGDKDLATHIMRTQQLRSGARLSAVCDHMTGAFKVRARVLPATDDALQTVVQTPTGNLNFQHYFVRDQCEPVVTGFEFVGASGAQPTPAMLGALASDALEAIIVCPSNPFISIDPILAVPGVRAALQAARAPVVAVSPIIAGSAVKGPTAKMMTELGLEVSAASVATHYGDLLDGYIVDFKDLESHFEVGLAVSGAATLMGSRADKRALAARVLAFARELSGHR